MATLAFQSPRREIGPSERNCQSLKEKMAIDRFTRRYLFQLGLLDLLPELYGEIVAPEGVILELRSGIERGVELPIPSELSWLRIRKARSAEVLTLAARLGAEWPASSVY